MKFNKVTKVEKISGREGKVYDLRISEVPNYSTNISIVHNGGGKRKGSFAIYLEPWHSDVEDFLELRKNTGKEERRARDLFLALWIPDLFMERVNEDSTWSLFSPSEVPNLHEKFGEEFNASYLEAEQAGKARKTIKARDLWGKILDSQIETGTPYILFKDAANRKSNQQNLGTIKSSNLCLSGDTLVKILHNNTEKELPIKEIVSLFKSGEVIYCKSVDLTNEKNIFSYQIITAGALIKKSVEVIEIEDELSGKKIVCTENHLIYTTNRGFVKAGDLLENDTLMID